MNDQRRHLEMICDELGQVAVAVSGGVDSLTLMSLAHRQLGRRAAFAIHAVSPAVPKEATDRVRLLAHSEGWEVQIIDAREFADSRYRANPSNRCFFCKTNLYRAIMNVTARQIVSGANLDDLGEYRPGLDAAQAHRVRHPFIEAKIDKAAIRALARELGLGEVADLPASPCLASRVETGIRVEAAMLQFIHHAEQLVAAELGSAAAMRTIRCRIRQGGIVIELDCASLRGLGAAAKARLQARIYALAPPGFAHGPVLFAPYRNGSAFLRDRSGAAQWTA